MIYNEIEVKVMKLKDIPGQKIRMQYLNWLVFGETVALLVLMAVGTVLWIQGKTPLSEWRDGWLTVALLLLPLYAFSMVNRFWIGKVVCVLHEEGISYLEGKQVCTLPWDRITRMEYEPMHKSAFGHFCKVRLWSEGTLLATLHHAPYRTMTQAKKYKKDLQIGIDPWVWWVALITLGIFLVLWLFSLVVK